MKYIYFVRYTAIQRQEDGDKPSASSYQGQTEISLNGDIDCIGAIRDICSHLEETYHEGDSANSHFILFDAA